MAHMMIYEGRNTTWHPSLWKSETNVPLHNTISAAQSINVYLLLPFSSSHSEHIEPPDIQLLQENKFWDGIPETTGTNQKMKYHGDWLTYPRKAYKQRIVVPDGSQACGGNGEQLRFRMSIMIV